MELVIATSRKLINVTAIKAWFSRAFMRMIEARQAQADRRIAMIQLQLMTDYELKDIGISRGNIKRAVDGHTD